MARPRSFTRQRGSLRRKSTWSEGPFGTVSLSAAASVIFPMSQQAVVDGLTLVRTRGELSVFLSVATAALDGFRWAFGMCIVSENAAGVGVIAIPSPIVDADWDGWFVYDTGTVKGWDIIPATGANANMGSSQTRIRIDSRAMRKFKSTDVMVGVLAGSDEVGAAVINADLSTRFLVKLA